MKKYYFLILLFSVSFCFAQKYVEKEQTIPFELSPNGHIIVQATVNGVQGNFVFDTGAGMHLLTKDFADKVNNLEKTAHFHTGYRATGEKIVSDLWQTKQIELGDFVHRNAIVGVYDIDFPIAGLVSLTAFEDKAITINFEEKILTIESAESLQNRAKNADFQLPLLVKNDMGEEVSIGTMITLNEDLDLRVGLDSGAGFNVFRFNSRFMDSLKIDEDKIKTVTRASSFKPEMSNTYHTVKLASLADINGNTTVKDFKATFIDDLQYEGIMGINWIGNVITIDMHGKKMLVQR